MGEAEEEEIRSLPRGDKRTDEFGNSDGWYLAGVILPVAIHFTLSLFITKTFGLACSNSKSHMPSDQFQLCYGTYSAHQVT